MRRNAAALVVLAGVVAACTNTDHEQQTHVVPPYEDFAPLGGVLEARCGTLDCHGHPQRSLRVYGTNGLRLGDADVPGVDGGVTSDDEAYATYQSVISLEPELLERVYAEGGARPERLTLVRKARGSEAHKGNAAIREGDDADHCITSWVAGNVDAAACKRGAMLVRPP